MDLSRFRSSAFDRGAGRIKEALWVICKCVFFLPAWPLPSALRRALLRAFGASVGTGVVIRAGVNVTFPWRFRAGNHVWIGEDVLILSLAQVTLEDSVCLSQRAFLCTGSHDFRREDFALTTKPITIRSGSWIAAQAFVGPGVEVGPGSVVSAGSVVVEDVQPRVLVRGNPAVVLKFLEPPAGDSST